MTDTLTWGKTKDAIVIGIGAGLLAILGMLLRGQSQSNEALAEVRKDIAVIAAESKRDREVMADLAARVRVLETRR